MTVVTNDHRGHFLAGGERGESMSPAGRYPMNTTIAAATATNTIAAIPAIIIIVIAAVTGTTTTVTATGIIIVRHHHRIIPAIVQRLQRGAGAHGQELLLLLENDSLRVGFRTGYRSTLSHVCLYSSIFSDSVLCCLISSPLISEV